MYKNSQHGRNKRMIPYWSYCTLLNHAYTDYMLVPLEKKEHELDISESLIPNHVNMIWCSQQTFFKPLHVLLPIRYHR